MSIRKSLLKKYMTYFSVIGQEDSQWEGYTIAQNATSEEEKQNALLQIARTRYEESLKYPLDQYFRLDLKSYLRGKDVLEIGSNHGGASLAYFKQYNLKSITGIDTTQSQAEISKLFFKNQGITSNHDFVQGRAEDLPFPSNHFDAILSFDVMEHVSDVQAVMNECFRVLRKNGMFFLFFPSYYHPTQNHLTPVTKAPCVHWFFKPKEIMDIFWEMLDENPEFRDRKDLVRRDLYSWEKLWIVNGMTRRNFRKITAQNPWKNIQFFPVPIGSVGKLVAQKPLLKLIKYFSWIGARLPFIEEFTTQRIVYVFTK